MPRAQDSDVQKVVDNIDTSVSLTEFIGIANRLVTAVCGDSGYSAATLKDIETYIAAHLYAVKDRPASQEKVGEASVTYMGQSGMFLDSTQYGQTAKLLDYKGCLTELGKKTPSLKWLGTTYTE